MELVSFEITVFGWSVLEQADESNERACREGAEHYLEREFTGIIRAAN